MSKMGFFCCGATRPTLLYTYPSYGDIWLADDKETELADIQLLHGPRVAICERPRWIDGDEDQLVATSARIANPTT